MINSIKEKVIAKGMGLLSSPIATKLMESEQAGMILEKAMTLPLKLSDGFRANRERLTSLMELATQQDLDEVKRAIVRMEDLLREIKNESSDLLRNARGRDE